MTKEEKITFLLLRGWTICKWGPDVKRSVYNAMINRGFGRPTRTDRSTVYGNPLPNCDPQQFLEEETLFEPGASGDDPCSFFTIENAYDQEVK
jgi:hypothetical protein